MGYIWKTSTVYYFFHVQIFPIHDTAEQGHKMNT
jgi:hypothetical protein